MTVYAYPPICFACQRYRAFDADHPTAYCEAFPGGIPDKILGGGFDHRQPFPGDHDVRFLQAEGSDEALTAFERGKK